MYSTAAEKQGLAPLSLVAYHQPYLQHHPQRAPQRSHNQSIKLADMTYFLPVFDTTSLENASVKAEDLIPVQGKEPDRITTNLRNNHARSTYTQS
jgi:hypothetical protein